MKNILKKIKSCKGFTIQDLVIAVLVLTIFAGAIGTTFVAVFRVQSKTSLDEAVTLYAIQIMEYIDRVAYDEVKSSEETSEFEDFCRDYFGIPEGITIKIKSDEENYNKTIKKIELTLFYKFGDETYQLLLEKFKVKEI